MKATILKLPARFESETRFNLASTAVAPFRATLETELDRLKDRLLRQALVEEPDVAFYSPLRRAAYEAAALAWATAYPPLVFPVLFEEKVQEARRQFRRQLAVRTKSRALLKAVA